MVVCCQYVRCSAGIVLRRCYETRCDAGFRISLTRRRATRAHVALRGGLARHRSGPREGLWTGVSSRHYVPPGSRREAAEHRESGYWRCRWSAPLRRVLSEAPSAADPVGPLAHPLQPYVIAHVRILGGLDYRQMNACYREVKDWLALQPVSSARILYSIMCASCASPRHQPQQR